MRIALLISVLSTAICSAETPAACPWLTTGTAASVLGGPVTLSAQVESNWQGVCRFMRESGDQKEALEITIGKEDTHVCPQSSKKLIALGNEAVQCTLSNAKGKLLDVIAGRMRNVHFVVSITNPPPASTVPAATGRPPDPYGAPMLEHVAEQVVGNLY